MSFREFVRYIHAYESDTFSAEASKITESEATMIAQSLLKQWAEDNLDGTMISGYLSEIREVQE